MEIDADAIELLVGGNKIAVPKEAFYAEFERRREERKREKRKEQNRIYYLQRKQRLLAEKLESDSSTQILHNKTD
jgi:hypothetical protein